MRRSGLIIAAVAALGLALSPGLAAARAGDGGSFGSRGSRSFSAPPATNTSPMASPLQRSMTMPSNPAPAFGGAQPYARPGLFGGGGFMSGLMGGLIGAGIGGLLFGHGLFGGMGGFSSFIGLLLQIALVVWLVRFLLRRFGGGSFGMPFLAGVGPASRPMGAGPRPGGPMPGAPAGGAAPALAQADFVAFERTLQAVQAAWSRQDLAALRGLMTPEMLSYFNEQLSGQASRGVRNEVSDVRLLNGDLSESWIEGNRQYATVAMRFSMIDVTRDQSGRIVDGSPTEHITATEFWTFLRTPGGQWILSAIQQGR